MLKSRCDTIFSLQLPFPNTTLFTESEKREAWKKEKIRHLHHAIRYSMYSWKTKIIRIDYYSESFPWLWHWISTYVNRKWLHPKVPSLIFKWGLFRENNGEYIYYKTDWNRVCIIVSRVAHVTFCLLALTFPFFFYIFLRTYAHKDKGQVFCHFLTSSKQEVTRISCVKRIQNAINLMKFSPQNFVYYDAYKKDYNARNNWLHKSFHYQWTKTLERWSHLDIISLNSYEFGY